MASIAKDTIRVTCNLSTELVKKIEEYANLNGINRTSAISVLLSQALQGQQAMADLNKLLQIYEKNNLEKAILKEG